MKKVIGVIILISVLAVINTSCGVNSLSDKMADKIVQVFEDKVDEVAEDAEKAQEKIYKSAEKTIPTANIKEKIEHIMVDDDNLYLELKSIEYIRDDDILDLVFDYDNKSSEELNLSLSIRLNDLSLGYHEGDEIQANNSSKVSIKIFAPELRNFDIKSIRDVILFVLVDNDSGTVNYPTFVDYKEDSDAQTYDFLYDKKEIYKDNSVTIYDILKPTEENNYKFEKDILIENHSDKSLFIEITNLQVNGKKIDNYFIFLSKKETIAKSLFSSDEIYKMDNLVIPKNEEINSIDGTIRIYEKSDDEEVLIAELNNLAFEVNH